LKKVLNSRKRFWLRFNFFNFYWGGFLRFKSHRQRRWLFANKYRRRKTLRFSGGFDFHKGVYINIGAKPFKKTQINFEIGTRKSPSIDAQYRLDRKNSLKAQFDKLGIDTRFEHKINKNNAIITGANSHYGHYIGLQHKKKNFKLPW